VRRALALAAALAAVGGWGCSERKPSPSGGAQSATAPAPTAAATSPPPAPMSADPNALTFADGTPEKKVQDFCIDNYQKIDKCFADEAFWQILATLFFAQNRQMDDGTPHARQMWIGMRKDDFAGLIRQHRVRADCQASIRHQRWPKPETIARVVKARGDTCPAFANAFGSMIFVEGAFNQPR